MKEIKVFIAGSKSLTVERDAIRSVLQILSNNNTKKVLIRPYTYEEFKTSLSQEGRQKEYNRFIQNEADYVIFVLDGTIGGITLDEFTVAWKTFMSKKRPSIFVYHKPSATISPDIQKVIDKINQCGQYYTEYSDIENLKLKIENSFRRIIEEVSSKKWLWYAIAGVLAMLAIVATTLLTNTPTTQEPAQPAVNHSQPDLDSLQRANQAQIERLRQDSIARALQAEAERLDQERARLEEDARKAQQQRKAEAASKAKTTAATTKTAASSNASKTTSTEADATPKQVTTKKTDPFAEKKAKADNGDAAACYEVAMAYKEKNNLSAAFNYMKSAAEQGYTPAYIELAKMYHGGRGVAKNRTTAEYWYKKASDAGNAEARRILLNM